MQVEAKFKEGLDLHQKGNLARAQEVYGQVLTMQATHFDALHMLGMIAGQTQNSAQAVELIGKAIELNPNSAAAYSNHGNALNDLMQHQAAIDSYDKALAIKPHFAEAHYNRGNALSAMKNYQAAVESFDKAIAIKPYYAQAYANRGDALNELKQSQAAIDSYDRASALKPDYFEAYTKRGIALNDLKLHQAAIESYDKALAIKPDHAEAFFNRGVALNDLKLHQAAIESYDKALAIEPDHAEAFFNRGIALGELKQYHAAVESYDYAIAAKPDFAEAYSNRGVALSELNRYQAAIESFDRAIDIKPDSATPYCNRGNALTELKQYEAAMASYNKAIAIKGDYAEAHWNLSLCLLEMGDFERGWIEHEWRWKNEKISAFQNRRDFPQPLWLGKEPLQGKTILLYSEQGLGDTIQFCRYARLVSDLGARVILEVQKPLLSLLAHLQGVAELVSQGDALPAFDYHCPQLSLPLAFKTHLGNIPVSRAYISTRPSKVAQWKNRLGEKLKPRIGLVWSGRIEHQNDGKRSVPLSRFVKLLPNEFQYVSLQKELRDADKQTLESHPEILHFEEEIKDFTDTAALCELVDVVVSVDTSVAHLAGALGKPVWILLPFRPDWRWLLDRDDSPWYPSAKLYRQDAIGDWDGVFECVATDLRRICLTLQVD